jgi:hypothetical protein
MECFQQFILWLKTKMFLVTIKAGGDRERMYLIKKAKCLDKTQEECITN